MKFRITRTSNWSGERAPYEGTYLDKIEYKGTSYEHKYWAIDISSLEELIALRDKVGEALVIEKEDEEPGLPSIDIYDYYRE